MSTIISHFSIIESVCYQLTKSQNNNYLEDTLDLMINPNVFETENLQNIRTISGCQIKCTLIKHKTDSMNYHNFKPNSKCIIFLHGLGSNRFQCLYLAKYLPIQFSLCTFDFQGFGKSRGDNITFGIRQSEDINPVLQHLKNKKNIEQFIIWGRSMGAVTALIYSINLAQSAKQSTNSEKTLQSIKSLVIDSPFSDFKLISKYIGQKKLNLPQFVTDLVLDSIQQKLNTYLIDNKRWGKVYNPFKIRFQNQNIQTKIPTIFLYSLIDQVIPKQHSEKIIRLYQSPFEKIVMEYCLHNDCRPKNVVQKVFQYIHKFQFKSKIRSKLTFQSIKGQEQVGISAGKRGIKVQSKQKQKNKQIGIFNILNKRKSLQIQQQKVSNKHYNYNKCSPKQQIKHCCKTQTTDVDNEPPNKIKFINKNKLLRTNSLKSPVSIKDHQKQLEKPQSSKISISKLNATKFNLFNANFNENEILMNKIINKQQREQQKNEQKTIKLNEQNCLNFTFNYGNSNKTNSIRRDKFSCIQINENSYSKFNCNTTSFNFQISAFKYQNFSQ